MSRQHEAQRARVFLTFVGCLAWLGLTEVQHFDHAVRPDSDVRGFEIAVDDPRVVGRSDGVRDLPGDGDNVSNGERTSVDAGR
jgi:hypothetical protein